MPALSRLINPSRTAPDQGPAPASTQDLRAPRAPSPHPLASRLTAPTPKGQNRRHSDGAGKWLPAGSLDRDVDTIAATVDRLVSALNSRDWMTPPHFSQKADRSPTGATAPDDAREADDLSFAEGADFREIARRIAEFRKSRPDPADAAARPARRIVRRTVETPAAPPAEAAATPATSEPRDRRDAGSHAAADLTGAAAPAAPEAQPEDGFDSWARQAEAALADPADDGAPQDDRAGRIDWPSAPTVANRPWSPEPRPGTAVPAESSLRQRLAALRARVSGTASGETVDTAAPDLDPAPAFTPEAPAGPVSDTLAAEPGKPDQDAAAPVEALDDAWMAVEDDPAVSGEAVSGESEEIETWTATGDNEDISSESLLAALDAHLASQAETDLELAREAAEDETAPGWSDTAQAAAAEEDRRMALETANRSEELARATSERIDGLLERMADIEAQDLGGRLTALADRFDSLDQRLDAIAAAVAAPVDLTQVLAPLDSLETRLGSLEASISEQHSALSRMLGDMSGPVAELPKMAERMIGFESHLQELALRLETHELNVRAMKALADAMERLEARLARPRAEASPAAGRIAPRHPANQDSPRLEPAAQQAHPAAPQAPKRSHAMSEREAILERYRRQARPREE